jgi:hypothetical protein
MISTKLILVDGLPGAGKSTIAQFLALQLERQQIPVRWFYELEPNHPIHAFHVWSRKGPERFMETTLENWNAFAQTNAHSSRVSILESTFFQSTVRLLLQSDVSPARIRHYVRQAAKSIQALQPTFMYLPCTDVAVALQDICKHRRKMWEQYVIQVIDSSLYSKHRNLHGFEGTVSFFQDYQQLTNTLFARLSMRKITCEDAKQGWMACRQRLCQFLDIRYISEPALAPEEALRYSGRYRDENTRLELRVYVHQQQLIVCDLLWPKSRLIYKRPNHFDVEACTISITFNETSDGNIRSMTIGGSRGWKFYGRTLIKIEEPAGSSEDVL